MIERLSMRDLGVIQDAEIELAAGLTVLTGETGAGKTMVLTALNLLLGGKSSPSLATSDKTRVQGVWRVNPRHQVVDQVIEAGGLVEGGELMFTRTMPANGRSRSSAGGVAVPLPLLADWGAQLVAVHGQSDQSLLRREAQQRFVLDRFAGAELDETLGRYATTYAKVRQLDEALATAVSGKADRDVELARLRDGLTLIEKLAPQPGEDVELAERARRLANLDELNAAANGAQRAVAGESDGEMSVVQLAADAKRALDLVIAMDPELAAVHERLSEIVLLAGEVGLDLARYLADLDAQPAELEFVQTRRSELNEATRSYGPTLDDVISWSQSAAQRVYEIESIADLDQLRHQRDQARSALAELADEVSALRLAAGERFGAEVSEELRGLSMPNSTLVVEIATKAHRGAGDGLVLPGETEPVAFGPNGIDEVRFLLSSHQGAQAAPLASSASGGELSRVMLALEVVLAASATAPTFVFDEVDAGVGGRAAVEIGKRLARLAKTAQVLVVTHLPQVAAFADQHLVVNKQSDGQVTRSDVLAIDGEDRVRELARMLAGQDESEHAAAHANELLDLAALERVGPRVRT